MVERTCYDFAVRNPRLTISQLNHLYKAKEITLFNIKPVVSNCEKCERVGTRHIDLFSHGGKFLCYECHKREHEKLINK